MNVLAAGCWMLGAVYPWLMSFVITFKPACAWTNYRIVQIRWNFENKSRGRLQDSRAPLDSIQGLGRLPAARQGAVPAPPRPQLVCGMHVWLTTNDRPAQFGSEEKSTSYWGCLLCCVGGLGDGMGNEDIFLPFGVPAVDSSRSIEKTKREKKRVRRC